MPVRSGCCFVDPPGCILYRNLYSYRMVHTESEFSVTEASSRGVAGLVASAERGETVIVTRRNRRVAAVVGMDQLNEIGELRDDLRDLVLVLAREATDTGRRTSMDEVLSAFGHTRESLAELPE